MEKIRAQKKQLNELEETVEKKFLPRIIFDEKTKISNDKIYDLQQRLKEIDKRSDFGPMIDR
jgi:tetrahydromethanopterin S-methyltransferase subunit G